MVKKMEKENLLWKMVINFKVISKMIKLKAMENTLVLKVNNMKVNGRIVY